MVTDPIGDFLVRIQNAASARRAVAVVPYSSIKEEIAKTLLRDGYIDGVERQGKGIESVLEITLKYNEDSTPRVHEARRVSKPSRRMYSSYAELKPFKYGKGRRILSTPKGILTDVEAKKEKVGGEIL